MVVVYSKRLDITFRRLAVFRFATNFANPILLCELLFIPLNGAMICFKKPSVFLSPLIPIGMAINLNGVPVIFLLRVASFRSARFAIKTVTQLRWDFRPHSQRTRKFIQRLRLFACSTNLGFYFNLLSDVLTYGEESQDLFVLRHLVFVSA